MPRKHDSPCGCDECWGEDLKDKYPELLANFSAQEVAEVWISYSDRDCASWLMDTRDSVFQVFRQYPIWAAKGKPLEYNWRTGIYFDINKIDEEIKNL